MVHNYCSVLNCKSRYRDNRDGEVVRFHRFPLEKEILDVWVAACGQPQGWEPTKKSYLCSKHFSKDCYDSRLGQICSKRKQPYKKPLLKPDSVPTIFGIKAMSQNKRTTSKSGTNRGQKKTAETYGEVLSPPHPGTTLKEYWSNCGPSSLHLDDTDEELKEKDTVVISVLHKVLPKTCTQVSEEATTSSTEVVPDQMVEDSSSDEDDSIEFLPLSVRWEKMQLFDEGVAAGVSRRGQADLCRVCAQASEGTIKIFGSEGRRRHLAEKMKQHLPIPAPSFDDNLPLSICPPCATRLDDCQELAQLATWADTFLRRSETDTSSRPETARSRRKQTIASKKGWEKESRKMDASTSKTPAQASNQKVYQALRAPSPSSPDSDLGVLFRYSDNSGDSDYKPSKGINKRKQTYFPRKRKRNNDEAQWSEASRENDMKKRYVKYNVNYEIFCNICEIKSTNTAFMKTHYKKVHKKSMCKVCLQWFNNVQQLNRHCFDNHKIYCKFCTTYVFDQQTLKKHTKQNHKDKYPHFVPHKVVLPERVPCTLCNAISSSKIQAKKHYFQEHHKYACDICLELFENPDIQLDHTEEIHAIPCSYCNLKYYSRRTFNKHQNIEHKEKNTKFLHIPQSPSKIFQCKTCYKGVSNKINLKRHTFWSHNRYTCDFCLQEYMNCEEGDLHFNRFHGHTCHFCDVEQPSVYDMIAHIKRDHGDMEPFSCEHCGMLFSDRNDMKLHRSEHEVVEQYHCDKCNRSFNIHDSLESHKQVRHGKRDIECNICCKKFVFPSHLKAHMGTHTKEKPFKCLDCGISYAQARSLEYHMKIHIKDKAFKTHICHYCKEAFLRKHNLRKHVQALHSNITIYKCMLCKNTYATENDVISHLVFHKPLELSKYPEPFVKTIALKCDFCDQFYPSKDKMETHISNHLNLMQKRKLKKANKAATLGFTLFVTE